MMGTFLLLTKCFVWHVYLSDVSNSVFASSLPASVRKLQGGSAGLFVEAFELREGLFESPYVSQLWLTSDDVDDLIKFI